MTLTVPVPCEARRYGKKGPCKLRAHWALKALKPTKRRPSWECGRSGSYCYTHIASELSDHEAERKRTNDWIDAHPEALA